MDDFNTHQEKTKLWEKGNEYRSLNDAELSCTIKHIEALKIVQNQVMNIR